MAFIKSALLVGTTAVLVAFLPRLFQTPLPILTDGFVAPGFEDVLAAFRYHNGDVISFIHALSESLLIFFFFFFFFFFFLQSCTLRRKEKKKVPKRRSSIVTAAQLLMLSSTILTWQGAQFSTIILKIVLSSTLLLCYQASSQIVPIFWPTKWCWIELFS